MKVYIDAACDILYSSYYVQGFKELNCKVVFTSKYFKIFKLNNQFVPIVIRKNNHLYKIIIDFGDGSGIEKSAYEWSDKYFKINCKFGDSYQFDKLISIGPSFGVNPYNRSQIAFFAIFNFVKARKRIIDLRRFFSNYRALTKRLSYDCYTVEKSRMDYIYFTASIWKNEKETNNFRLNFIKSCKAIFDNNFEGGFAPRSNGDNLGFDEFIINSRVSLSEYIKKIKDSLVVFNTPAVLHCHGWKLAEYLALGKVIISTPISRELPEVLIDRRHLLITDGTQNDIEQKINEIISNQTLYNEISSESRKYFDKYLSPKSVCQIIINDVKQ